MANQPSTKLLVKKLEKLKLNPEQRITRSFADKVIGRLERQAYEINRLAGVLQREEAMSESLRSYNSTLHQTLIEKNKQMFRLEEAVRKLETELRLASIGSAARGTQQGSEYRQSSAQLHETYQESLSQVGSQAKQFAQETQ